MDCSGEAAFLGSVLVRLGRSAMLGQGRCGRVCYGEAGEEGFVTLCSGNYRLVLVS